MIFLHELPDDIIENIFIRLFDGKRFRDCMNLALVSKIFSNGFRTVTDNQCSYQSGALKWIYNHRETPLHDAIKEGNLDTVKWFYETVPLNILMKFNILHYAIKYDQLNIVKWIHEIGLEYDFQREIDGCNDINILEFLYKNRKERFTDRIARRAAEEGRLELLKWIHKNRTDDSIYKVRCTMSAMDFAARGGHLECVKFLHEIGASCTTWAMDMASQNGHSHVIKWLNKNRTEGCYYPYWPHKTLTHDSIFDCIKLLYSIGKLDIGKTINTISGTGYLDIIIWLYKKAKQNGKKIVAEEAMEYAALSGHLHILQWLHRNGVGKRTPDMYDKAAHNGHLNVVRWLNENKIMEIPNTAMVHAAQNGHLEIIKYLFKNTTKIEWEVLQEAAQNGHLEIVKWIFDQENLPYSRIDLYHILHRAASNGNISVVKWFYEHFNMLCSLDSVVDAILNGHVEIIQWYYEKGGDIHRILSLEDDLILAAIRGHLDVIKWFYTNERIVFDDMIQKIPKSDGIFDMNVIEWIIQLELSRTQ